VRAFAIALAAGAFALQAKAFQTCPLPPVGPDVICGDVSDANNYNVQP
jgi:hypothetical protein